MGEGHVSQPDQELFAAGGMVHSGWFESHVSSCGACARRLSGEARLELVLEELAGERRRLARVLPAALLRHGLALGAGLALAASLLLCARAGGTRGGWPDGTGEPGAGWRGESPPGAAGSAAGLGAASDAGAERLWVTNDAGRLRGRAPF